MNQINHDNLFMKTPVAETLILDVSQIRISRILFQYYHRPQGSQNDKSADHETLEMISFPKNLLGLDVKLDLPPNGEANSASHFFYSI
jgi:hypothetical protein